MLNLLKIYAFVLAVLPSLVHAALLYGGYAKQECYSALDGWSSMGSSDTQTAGTCGGQCSDAGLPLFALSGQECYCGSSYPSSSAQSNSGSCSTPCSSYPDDTCGGSGAFVVYSIDGKQASSAPASSAPPTTQSSSQNTDSTSSSTTPSQSTTGATTPTTQSSSNIDTPSSNTGSSSSSQAPNSQSTSALVSSTASDESSSQSAALSSTSSAQTVTVTASSSTNAASASTKGSSASSSRSSSATSTSSTSSASSRNSATHSSSSSNSTPTTKLDPNDKSSANHHGVSGGAIAGIVVGVVAGLVIITGLVLLLCLRWRKRDREDEYYSPTASPDQLKSNIGSFHNPYPERPVVDQRLNPAMLGDPRISIASLADARDYSRQILKVANPDEKSIM